jgi:hypothetical protein
MATFAPKRQWHSTNTPLLLIADWRHFPATSVPWRD